MQTRRLSADWLIPVEGEPIPAGAVLIGERGRIILAGTHGAVPSPPGVAVEHYAGAAILPGFVNTHTHLELTGLPRSAREADFADWIAQLRAAKERRSAAEYRTAAREGLAQCHAAGVTTIADTGDSGAVIEALAAAGGSGIAYLEVFGPHPDQLAESLAGLEQRAEACAPFAGPRVQLGVSPHAPYTVSAPLYRETARWARERGLPLAVHIAESPEESALLKDGTGVFAERWNRRGIPLPNPLGDSPVAWLERHGVLGADTLCIHAVQVSERDIVRLQANDAAVAHCPHSNRVHRHGEAPLRQLLDAGLRVGCGTDSVASVGALDLLAEVRAARAIAGLDAAAALRLCTLDVARAIGLHHEVGSLAAGKWGDVVVVRTTGSNGSSGVLEAILATAPRDVLATWLGGRKVFSARSPLAARGAESLA